MADYLQGANELASAAAGGLMGTVVAYEAPQASAANIAAQPEFGGTLPTVADIVVSAGKNPHWFSESGGPQIGLFAIGQAGADGTIPWTRIPIGQLAWGTTARATGVPIDPALGGIALFAADVADPALLSFRVIPTGAPAPVTGSGSQPAADPNAIGPVNPSSVIDHALIAGGIVVVLIVVFLVLSAKAEKAGLKLLPWLSKKFGG